MTSAVVLQQFTFCLSFVSAFTRQRNKFLFLLLNEHGVVVSAAIDGGKLMGYFNLPWFAWGSAEMNLGDSEEYNTLVRVTSPYDRLATAIIKLFVYYNV